MISSFRRGVRPGSPGPRRSTVKAPSTPIRAGLRSKRASALDRRPDGRHLGRRPARDADERASAGADRLVGAAPRDHRDGRELAALLWPGTAPERSRANLRTAIWAVHRRGASGPSSRTGRRSPCRPARGRRERRRRRRRRTPASCCQGWTTSGAAGRAEPGTGGRSRPLGQRGGRRGAGGRPRRGAALTRRLCQLRPARRGRAPDPGRAAGPGRRTGSAVVTAREFSERLRDEVGVRPSPATRAVHAAVRAGAGAERPAARLRPGRRDRLADRAVAEAADGPARSSSWSARRGSASPRCSPSWPAGPLPPAATPPWRPASTSRARRRSPRGSTWPGDWPRACARSRRPPPGRPSSTGSPSGLGARLGHPQQPPAATAPELERLRVFEAILRLVEWSCAERPTLLASTTPTGPTGRAYGWRRTSAGGSRRCPRCSCSSGARAYADAELDGLLADLAGRGVAVSTLDVPPISDSEVGALARSLHALDGDAVDKVVAAAEGNPLLAVETIRALVAGSAGPPANLRAAVGATVAGCRTPTPGGRRAARGGRAAAAAGRAAPSRRADRAPTIVSGSRGVAGPARGRWSGSATSCCARRLRRAGRPCRPARPAGRRHRPGRARRAGAPPGRGRAATESAPRWPRRPRGRARSAPSTRRPSCSSGRSRRAPDDGALWLELEEVHAWAHRQADMEAAWAGRWRLLPPDALPDAWCRRGRQFRSVICHPEESLRAYRSADRPADARRRPRAPGGRPDRPGLGRRGGGHGRGLRGPAGRRRGPLPVVDGPAPALGRRGDPDAGPDPRRTVRRAAVEAALVAAPRGATARSPDRAFALLTNAACALTCVGDDEGALGSPTRRSRRPQRAVGAASEPRRARPGPGAARSARGGPETARGAGHGRPARRPGPQRHGGPRRRARGAGRRPVRARRPSCSVGRWPRAPRQPAAARSSAAPRRWPSPADPDGPTASCGRRCPSPSAGRPGLVAGAAHRVRAGAGRASPRGDAQRAAGWTSAAEPGTASQGRTRRPSGRLPRQPRRPRPAADRRPRRARPRARPDRRRPPPSPTPSPPAR